jgi:transcriptional regulator with XRE-family HTH domain
VTIDDQHDSTFRHPTNLSGIAAHLRHPQVRHGYMGRQLKAFLAQQIRSLRGEYSQKEFGGIIGKPQSVVSRLEKQADRHISIQTLIDIAGRLDIAVIVRFVDYPTFLRYTDDYSESAIAPARYSQANIDALVHVTDSTVREGALKALFGGIPDQAHGASAIQPTPRRTDHILTAPLEAPANDIAPTFSEGDGDITLSAAMRQIR